MAASDHGVAPLHRTAAAMPECGSGVAWFESPGLVPYPEAVASMEERVAAIRSGAAPETVWLLQHPPVYTAGTSARGSDLIDPGRFPVYRSGRGGRYTYHGPGQRVAYVMLDLRRRGSDVRAFVAQLESWVIASLARFGVTGERRAGRIGIWVGPDGADAKIAAIGVRIRGWVTYHGVAVNVSPDLGHFSGIVPCGLADRPVTSLHALGVRVGLDAIDAALRATFAACFPPPQ